MNPEPLIVTANETLPANAELGDRLVITGAGLLRAKICGAEAPPPGAELKTVTLAVLAGAKSAVVRTAVSWVLLIKVVARGEPFHCTAEPLTKPEPVTVRVSEVVPARALLGLRAVRMGAGRRARLEAQDRSEVHLRRVHRTRSRSETK